MSLLILYVAFAGALAWAGHMLVGKRRRFAASGSRRVLLTLLSVVLLVLGMWFTNIVAYTLWAAGGPDRTHKEWHLSSAYWALAIASLSFLARELRGQQAKGRLVTEALQNNALKLTAPRGIAVVIESRII